jgi:hypothetical protein
MSDPDPSRSPLGLSLLPAIVFSLFLLGCSADVAIIATPVSGGLFDQEHLEAARERGVGRVVLVAPGDLSRPGIVRPGVGEETALLLMPDVASEEVATIEGRSRLALSLDHGNSGAGVLALDRRPAFGRLGELVGEYVGNGLENDRRDAETITVRVFALQGGEDRIAEMRALLEPIRRRIPAEAIVVEEVVSGFSVSAIQERLREAGPKDPLLLFLGAAGSELFSQAREGEGPVAGEALFVPAQSVPLAEGASLEPGDALLLGVDPVDLFEATKAGETARIEARLFRASDLF